MSADNKREFWLEQFSSPERALIHFVPSRFLDLKAIRAASHEIGFAVFEIDCEPVHSVDDLRNRISKAMKSPSESSHNWDAFQDMTTDLSWITAPGFILILSNADALSSLAK